MNTNNMSPEPESAPQQNGTQASSAAKAPRSSSEKTWMTIGIASLSILLLGGAVTAGIAIGNASGSETKQIFSGNQNATGNTGTNHSKSNATDGAQSTSRGIDIDNNENSPLGQDLISEISKAALVATGNTGVVTDIENEIGRSTKYAYEVEVERSDRTEATVYLSETLEVIKVLEDETWDETH